MPDRDIVEEIKRNLSLESVAYPDGDVSKRGTDIQGEHPIHGSSETGKNFIIHTDSQSFHCFRCNSSGDVLDFIAIREGLIDCEDAGDISDCFTEVLEIAADEAGVDLEWDDYDKEEMQEKKAEWEKIQDCYQVAVDYWKENLDDRPEAKEWIEEKYGFGEEVIEEYDIGFAPNKENVLLKKMEDEAGAIAHSTGLVMQTSSGNMDFFQGRVVFPYTFRDDYIYFIGRKTPWTDDEQDWQKGKYIKQLTPENHDYVNDQIHNALWGLDTIRGEEEVIVTEGITDAIALADWGHPVLSPVTVRFRREDINKVKRAIRDKEVYICNDNDEGGLDGAIDTLEEINNSYMIEFSDKLPGGYDLNDFYIEHTKEEFEDLKEHALPRDEALAKHKEDVPYLFYPALRENAVDPSRVRKRWDSEAQRHEFFSLETILDDIDDIESALSVFRRTEKTYHRTPTAVERSIRRRIISGVIRRHMQKYGKFLYDRETDRVYYFSEEKHEVVNINSPTGESYLDKRYGVNTSNKKGKFVLKSLKNYAVSDGEEVDVKKYFYYDKEENVLYIHNRNHHYYILDGESIERRFNGEDVYFETMHEESIEYLEEGEREYMDEVPGQIEEWEDEGDFLHQVMVNRINFTSKTALTKRQQRLQMFITMYMFPFGTTFQAKPITAFIGEKGSGKSVIMKILGGFLTKPDFDVTNMPDEEDFYVAAHNNPMYFLDNVDKESKWLNDALAAVATGASMKQRELYTNYELTEAKLDTFLGLTSRTPHFKRDDVVDRLLIFYISRIEDNIKPVHLTEPIHEYRDTLWSEYMEDLNKIVEKMDEVDTKNMTTKHRLVDWVVFAKVVQKALGLDEDKIEKVIDDMRYEKLAFSMEDDRLLPALRNLKESPMHDPEDRWLPATKLHELLSEADDLYDNHYKSAQSLARKLPNIRTELEELVGLKMKRNRNKHRNEYMLVSDDSGLDDFLKDEHGNGEDDETDSMDITEMTKAKTLKRQIVDLYKDEPDPEEERTLGEIVEEIDGYTAEEIENQIDRMEKTFKKTETKDGVKFYEYLK